jgi:CDP-2,3-bis-(O-geranylgeranyl)-sn-glycerol synthase
VAGFLLGVIVALGTAFLQSAIDWKGSLVDYAHWPALGLALGIGALGGDALKSLVKRARGIAPGKSWVPFDQLDFAVGALALVWPWARLGWRDVLLILAFTFVADIVVNHAAYRLGIRDTRW